MVFEEKESSLSSFTKTLVYNIFVLGIIVGVNHYGVRSFTLGYLPLYANTVMIGLFAGTNSFSGGISAYTLEGWLLFLQIGFLEFSAYIFACVATVNLAMFYAERWRGEKFRKIRRFKEVKLSKYELLFLLVSLILLVLAAFNECRYLMEISAISPNRGICGSLSLAQILRYRSELQIPAGRYLKCCA